MPSVLAVLSFVISTVLSASIPLHTRWNEPSFAPTHGANFPISDPTHGTDFNIHDPSIIRAGDTYYAYSVGHHIVIHSAPSLSGPWKRVGTVLEKDSVIPKGDRKAPWAPTVLHAKGKYYCYYSVSQSGSRNSAIGVATSLTPGAGQWTDHGVVAQSGKGPGSGGIPFDRANTIDPSVVIGEGGKAYLTFGSFWTGIWQVPLGDNLISLDFKKPAQAKHLVSDAPAAAGSVPEPLNSDPHGPNPVEGSFISYTAPWYYLWFSYGNCCDFDPKNLPPAGTEYSIRVGRSKSPRGPFLDREGKDLANGGGAVVYGSNGDTYAPGGQQVLKDGDTDILYYHYLNKTIGYSFNDARLGFNPLKYVDGWPVAV
ncbi:hypothetical protein PHISCL_07197 [Aspergillus sclerotialis]|uniref:Arabinan endo-1,5-alpha-L-arabinosidase n=1 Tax=Aspergillus sclerotialis TaxID=2070753 RepID=A0A3A2ZTY0_9EURO|nr:hypothetical protein PHISCL_07197 [Aspergillus sclerotialis]